MGQSELIDPIVGINLPGYVITRNAVQAEGISAKSFKFLTVYKKKHLFTRITNTIRAEIFAEQVFAVSRSKNCESRGILFHH